MEDMFYASKLGNKTIEEIFETSDESIIIQKLKSSKKSSDSVTEMNIF